MRPGGLSALRARAPDADRARRAGRWSEAERALNRRLGAAPDDAELYALKAELLRASPERRESEAVEQARRALALAGGAAWARGVLARALAAAGDLAGAERELDEALRGPSPSWLRIERAHARLARGDAEGALADARGAGPDAALVRAAALARAGRFPEALSAVRGARGAEPRRGAPDAERLRSDLLASLGRWKEAAAARRALAERGAPPSWPLPEEPGARAALLSALAERARSSPRDAWAWAWCGEARLRAGAPGALEALDRAARLSPALGWARLARARARVLAGDLAGARVDARAAARDARVGAEALVLAGDLAAALGRGAESEASYRKALAAGAERAGTRARLAAVLAAVGRGAEARRELDLCLEEAPGHARAAELRAALREGLGDRAGAEADRARAAGGEAGTVARGPFADLGPGEGPERPGRGRVGLDARVELAGLLQRAAENPAVPEFLRREEPALAACAEEAVRRFLPKLPPGLPAEFRRIAAARGNAAFPWFGITQSLMSVSPPPDLTPVRRAWRDGADLRLLAALRDFGRRSGFWSFCADADRSLTPRLKPLRAAAAREDYAATVSAYAGRRISAFYEIAVSPLLRGVNLRAILLDDDGGRGARTVLCPSTSPSDLAALSPEADFVLWSGWHEHLHLLLDPWTELHAPEARRHEARYARIAPAARRKGWLDSLSEHFVRACTQRLVERRRGPAAAEALRAEDEAEGYPFAARLARSLRDDYEPRRGRYPDLLAFLPRWLEDWRDAP